MSASGVRQLAGFVMKVQASTAYYKGRLGSRLTRSRKHFPWAMSGVGEGITPPGETCLATNHLCKRAKTNLPYAGLPFGKWLFKKSGQHSR